MGGSVAHLDCIVGGGVRPQKVHEDYTTLLHCEGAVEDLNLLDAVDAAPDASMHTQNLALHMRCQRQPVEHLQISFLTQSSHWQVSPPHNLWLDF